MLVKGLAGSIDQNGGEAVKAAEEMANDISSVMDDLASDVQFPVSGGNVYGAADFGQSAGSNPVGASATLGTLVSLLNQYLPYLPQIANLQLVTDTGALVGALAAPMNLALGKISIREARR